jgi:hypothetical protein
MYYNTNGIPSELPKPESFWVEEFMGNFVFKEGDITSDIDFKCVALRYEVAKKLFGSTEEYYRLAASAPIFFPYGGIDAEIKISKEEFESLVNKIGNHEISNKMLYYYDITNILGTLQNGILETKYILGEFYRTLNLNSFLLDGNRTIFDNGVQFASGVIVTNITSLVNHLFISLYSQLDFITKFIYEFENIATDFTAYPKLKSRHILYGDMKKTSLKDLTGSLFDQSVKINMVISLRNEIVHNASFDSMLKVYQVIENNVLVEKFILLPDLKNGFVKTFRNRKRFFDDGTKLNEILPELVTDFWKRLQVTLNAIVS